MVCKAFGVPVRAKQFPSRQAFLFKDGVLVAGDRRATMGHTVMYDRADKVLAIDDCAVMALAGSPAMAYEIARILEISFQHHRRSQLQELSLDGKLRTLSRLLKDNLPMPHDIDP